MDRRKLLVAQAIHALFTESSSNPLVSVKRKPRHDKRCEECLYSLPEWREGGLHCYMYRDEPQQSYCGQFEQRPSKPEVKDESAETAGEGVNQETM